MHVSSERFTAKRHNASLPHDAIDCGVFRRSVGATHYIDIPGEEHSVGHSYESSVCVCIAAAVAVLCTSIIMVSFLKISHFP